MIHFLLGVKGFVISRILPSILGIQLRRPQEDSYIEVCFLRLIGSDAMVLESGRSLLAAVLAILKLS